MRKDGRRVTWVTRWIHREEALFEIIEAAHDDHSIHPLTRPARRRRLPLQQRQQLMLDNIDARASLSERGPFDIDLELLCDVLGDPPGERRTLAPLRPATDPRDQRVADEDDVLALRPAEPPRRAGSDAAVGAGGVGREDEATVHVRGLCAQHSRSSSARGAQTASQQTHRHPRKF